MKRKVMEVGKNGSEETNEIREESGYEGVLEINKRRESDNEGGRSKDSLSIVFIFED